MADEKKIDEDDSSQPGQKETLPVETPVSDKKPEDRKYTADAWNNLRHTWKAYLSIQKKLLDSKDDDKKLNIQNSQLEKIIETLLNSLGLDSDKFKESGFDARNALDANPEKHSDVSKKDEKNILFPFTIATTIIIVVASFVFTHFLEFQLEYSIWVSSITIGVASVILLLVHTTNLKYAKHFSRLPVYQFLALSVLIICMITAISFLPNALDGVPISKTIIQQGNSTIWFLSIGEKEVLSTSENQGQTAGVYEKVVLQIPYYILIPGLLGAYIKYLYKDNRTFRKSLKKDLEQLKQYSLDYKNKIFEISLALDIGLDEIQNSLPKDKRVRLKDLLYVCNRNNSFIYTLPPEAIAKFSRYIKDRFSELTILETKYEKQQFSVGNKTNNKSLTVIGAFFLAPLLAVVGWLIADLSGEINKEALIIIAFGAGMSADAIVKKMWEFTGEKMQIDDEDEPKVTIESFSAEPSSGNIPLNVQFTLKINSDFKEIKWNFGDDNTDTGGLSKTHTYKTVGKYAGKVIVTDKQNETIEKGFTINATKPDE